MCIYCGYTILHATLTCSGTEVVGWSSSGNGSSLLFDDGRLDTSKLPCPDVIQLAAKQTLTGPASSDTKTEKTMLLRYKHIVYIVTQNTHFYLKQGTTKG